MQTLRYALALVAVALTLTSTAQRPEHWACGTTPVDLDDLRADIARGKALAPQARGMVTYIPLRFQLIARDDTTGSADPNKVLDLMRAVNVDFAPHDWQFYLADSDGKPWGVLPSTNLYENHAASQSVLRRLKASDAMTVYVPNTATPPGGSDIGVTLGYYSRSNDYLVFRRSEVGSNSSTATHEIGHYFGLPHPFRGWDCTGWDGLQTIDGDVSSPVMLTSAPCSSVPVELVTRGPDANCTTAGDLFCDTPADYNLGFGWSDCNYTGGVRDRNNELIRPDEENVMGYFLNCSTYRFSDEQVQSMRGNYAAANRRFLRDNATPANTAEVDQPVTFTFPAADGDVADFFDDVTIAWEAVPNATYYYLEVSTRRSFSVLTYEEVITDGRTSVRLTDLEADDDYYVRVRPFSNVSFGAPVLTRTFSTSSLSGANSAPPAVDELAVYPNPLGSREPLRVRAAVSTPTDAVLSVADVTGRELSRRPVRLLPGGASVELDDLTLTPGTYSLTVRSARGTSSRAFVVR